MESALTPTTREIATRLLDWAVERKFEGIDPYDALNSPFSRVLSLGTRWGRIAWTQALRRSPIDIRPLLGIRPSANPKALGLFLEGAVKLGADEICARLVENLKALRSPDASGSAWGYNFPWQNRFRLLPRWTPTIVNTSFIGHALLDYYARSQNESALELAWTTVDFILNDLRRKSAGQDAFCFSYTPLDENYVHNANMLGASLLARFAVEFGRAELLDPALCALKYSMNAQHEDGSWFYAERREQRWIDSFHTGFNLEALRRFVLSGLTPEYYENYSRGVEFYAKSFFLEDGAPKYYAERVYPIDVHAPAEGIFFFSGEGAKYRALAERVLAWTTRNLYDRKRGTFYFRKTRSLTIRTEYMRWSQAWAFRALSEYAVSTDANQGDEI